MSAGEEIQSAIDANLQEFEKHKDSLLNILRNAFIADPTCKSFDKVKAWFHLNNVAASYFFEAQVKRLTMPVSERVARLRSLAGALSNARAMTAKAMEDAVGGDLFSAWCKNVEQPLASVARKDDSSSFILIHPAFDALSKAMDGLSQLAAAASVAFEDESKENIGAGRPRGTAALPPGFIIVLASVYRKATNARPKAREGLFVQLVRGFLDATGHRGHPSERHLLETIEAECADLLANPSDWAPSPFDE